MRQYTEAEKQYYMGIIKAISEHADFGKRNPVDIGIDCGYTEEDVLGMIEMLRAMQDEEDEKKVTGGKNSGDKYYFLLHQDRDKAYIVSVEIDSWKVEIVKSIQMFQGGLLGPCTRIDKWQIKENVFVYTIRHSENIIGIRNNIVKEIYWENLETGEQRKLLTDENIQNFVIRESDVCIVAGDNIILWKNDGSVYKKEGVGSAYLRGLLLAVDDKIYSVDNSSVYKLDHNLDSQEIGRTSGMYKIGAVEYFNGKLSWYCYEKEVHIFSDYTWNYKTYTEGKGDSYSRNSTGFYARRIEESSGISGILVGVFSKNYRLLQDEIWSIDNKNKICSFKRKTSEDSNQGQVISIPEKDIFIGVAGEDKEAEYLIKIDLRNERQTQILPVKLP